MQGCLHPFASPSSLWLCWACSSARYTKARYNTCIADKQSTVLLGLASGIIFFIPVLTLIRIRRTAHIIPDIDKHVGWAIPAAGPLLSEGGRLLSSHCSSEGSRAPAFTRGLALPLPVPLQEPLNIQPRNISEQNRRRKTLNNGGLLKWSHQRESDARRCEADSDPTLGCAASIPILGCWSQNWYSWGFYIFIPAPPPGSWSPCSHPPLGGRAEAEDPPRKAAFCPDKTAGTGGGGSLGLKGHTPTSLNLWNTPLPSRGMTPRTSAGKSPKCLHLQDLWPRVPVSPPICHSMPLESRVFHPFPQVPAGLQPLCPFTSHSL